MEEDVHRYHGTEIEVSYDSNRCIHVRECVKGLPNVFDPNERPWIDLEDVDPDEVAAVIERCPTGALQYERLDGGDDETPPAQNSLTVVADGPLYLYGDIHLQTPNGDMMLDDTRVALCRCGHSENKPLCDNSHNRVFDADGLSQDDLPTSRAETTDEAASQSVDRKQDTSSRVAVTPTTDGPYRLDGSFTIRDSADQRHFDDATLCRCGSSENKPFCDGTHSKIGFSTDGE